MKGAKTGQKLRKGARPTTKPGKSKKKTPPVVSSAPSGEGVPASFTQEEASTIAKAIFQDNAPLAPEFHLELNELRERIPPNIRLGVVYAIPPFSKWANDAPYQFVPCTAESLMQQGCPKEIYEPFARVDTITRLYVVVGCPFLPEGETDRTKFSVYWEAGQYVLAECATRTKVEGKYYPTIDKSWNPSTHFGVCAMPGCFAKDARFLCTQCRRVFYCGVKCQEKHWPRHKIHECVTTATEPTATFAN